MSFTTTARRRQLLVGAVEALSELGYGGASLSQIAKRAGTNKGVLLYHFKDKDDLMGTVLADVYTRAGETIGRELAAADGPQDAVSRYVAANLEFLASHPSDIRAVVEIAANARRVDGSPRFGPRGDEQDPVLMHLVDVLRNGQRSGELGHFDARSLALLIRGAIDTASGRLASDPHFDLDSYAELLRSVVDTTIRPTSREFRG